jgi:signal-transduction protein with cAMP-binding, CBS, and nucleotidyltransferase domain
MEDPVTANRRAHADHARTRNFGSWPNDALGKGETMDTQETIYDEDLRYDEEIRPHKTLDERLFREPIKTLRRRAGHVAIPLGTTIGEAARVMKERRIGCVLVEDGGKLVGIFTERDILTKLVGTGYDPARVQVDGVMTRNPETLTPDDPIAYAMQIMSVGGFRHVPLVDADQRPVDILSVKDIVDYVVEHFPQEILNIPPEPGKHARIPEGG